MEQNRKTAEKLKSFFDQFYTAPIETWEKFTSFLKPGSFKKNAVIKRANEKENKFHFIIKGSAGKDSEIRI